MEISGISMLIGLLIGIALLIVLVLKTKVQAFMALYDRGRRHRRHAPDCDGHCECGR